MKHSIFLRIFIGYAVVVLFLGAIVTLVAP